MIENATLSIIIVNWNAGDQLIEAVASIAEFHHELIATVIVVDNASTDNSLVLVENIQKWPFQLQIIRNTNNRGFAAACNQGAAMATTPYLLFLNPDTRLFTNSLSRPLAFMEDKDNLNVGICGIQLIDEEGHVTRSCARFPTLFTFFIQALGLNKLPGLRQFSLHMSEWNHADTRVVDHVIGAFFLVRRSLFDKLKGFDERFFVYLEDLDFSRRAALLGYNTIYLAEAQAFHAGGGTSRQVKAARLFYSLRSRMLYGFKHFSLPAAWMVLLLTIMVEPVSRLIFSLLLGSKQDFTHTLQGYNLLFKDLFATIRLAFQRSPYSE
ncbi:MAG: glycosyltransferase family 2 protein [Methylomonas sp.]